MGHTWKNGSNKKKRKMGHTCKDGLHLLVTREKIGHTWENVSHLKRYVTLGKIGHN